MVSPLHFVDLEPGADSLSAGLVPVHGKRPCITLAEEAAVRDAALFKRVDYVFFRRFADLRSPQVAAYVVDNSDESLNEEQLSDLHWHVWMQGIAPLLYIAWPTRLDVLACAREPDFWTNQTNTRQYPTPERLALTVTLNSAGEIADALAREKARAFSSNRLGDGTFWEDPVNSHLVSVDQAAHHQLITAIVDTDRELEGDRNPLLRRLLLLTLLVKYLEDREVFPKKGWFQRFCPRAQSFHDLLRHGTVDEVARFFTFLEKRFNGDVFCFPQGGIGALTSTALRRFSDLVEARTVERQRYLWDQFSFRHLPVEVLSHLYQRFAQRDKGAVFTPPFVAALLLDYSLPYDRMSGNERVLDPTCGSGVFLVGAFRRLVQYWRSRHAWKQPSVTMLQEMLRNQIHGVELQSEALDLAAFNLALALCDALRPEIIWSELRFDRLRGHSLHEADFFDHAEIETQRFDLIIGNPPFQSTLTASARRYDANQANGRVQVPDQQIAYLVAERSMSLLADDGRICLLEPSGLIYNEKPRLFFRQFLEKHQIEKVLDFISIRHLFDEADTKVVALIARKSAPANTHRIEHLTFRRTISVDQKLGFELDHYDRHAVGQTTAATTPETWKINLLGGGRLHVLAARLAEQGTLKEFVSARGWEYGEGFIASEKGRREPAPWLHNKRLLPSEALTEKGVDEEKIGRVEATHFRSAYTPARYTPPLFLIRENEKLASVFWDDGFLAYKAQIVGISCGPSESQRRSLKNFADNFSKYRRELTAFCLLRGTRGLAAKATAINKTDIDQLPWPREGESWDLSDAERILCTDLSDYIADFVRTGQNSTLLRNAATPTDFSKYAKVFTDTLSAIHPSIKIGRSFSTDGLACQMFYFGTEPDLDWPENWAPPFRKLVYARESAALRTVRILRVYQTNVLLVVKPDRLRYWIRSTAIRDADETLADLSRQGF